jgi:hypothetical protein
MDDSFVELGELRHRLLRQVAEPLKVGAPHSAGRSCKYEDENRCGRSERVVHAQARGHVSRAGFRDRGRVRSSCGGARSEFSGLVRLLEAAIARCAD